MKPRTENVLFFHSQQRDRGPAEEKLRGIYRFARACGWHIIVLEAPQSPAEVRDQIRAWRPIGCIVDMNQSGKFFTAASLAGTPTSFLDFDNRQSSGKTFRVNHDPEAVGALAARHLSERGLSNYAFVGYSREWRWSDARKKFFQSHLGRDIDSFSSYVFPAGTAVPSAIRRKFAEWLAHLPKPCGMLLADDGLSGEVYPICFKLRLSIPNDVAILGVDDNERLCKNLNPPLSSILLDFSQAGWMVAELLHRRIHNPSLKPFVQTYNPLGIAPRASTDLPVTRNTPIAEKAKRLIAELATSGANVADISKHFACSRRLLELRFRQSTGISLLDAIRETRLSKACELLKTATMPIGAIVAQCGYTSESALKTYFKRRTGKSMSEWRKAASEGSSVWSKDKVKSPLAD